MNGLERMLESVSRLMARMGGGLLLAAAFLVATEVALRYTRLTNVSVATELSSYALAVSASWAMAYVVFERAHVRVDVVAQRLPPYPKAVLDIVGMCSLAVVGAILSFGGIEMVLTSLELSARANTTLGMPLAFPQGAWMVGLIWFTAIAIYRTVCAVGALFSADLARVTAIAGTPTSTEEVEDAISETTHRLADKEQA